MNSRAEKFHLQNKELVQNLYNGLCSLLDNLEMNTMPGEEEKGSLSGLLDSYAESLKRHEKSNMAVIRRVNAPGADSFDENNVIKELSGHNQSIELLLRLGREKMVDVADKLLLEENGKLLVKCGYCEEIIVEKTGRRYYVLSSKGEKSFRNKTIINQLRKDVNSAIVPTEIIFETSKWSNIYSQRIDMLSFYYKNYRQTSDYIAFTLDELKEMVFGCEIEDGQDVRYTFACVFENESKDENVNQLKSLAGSGLIDQILLLTESGEQQMDLVIKDGLDPQLIPELSYFVMQ
ncbi:hypothetical protein [Anaerobium acetethylicum]|uniref:Uncharacterized protein n=1 Tax=Anaerobium acetethylicum TaxID=1619234 RepID=A0A1D3TUN8_9FIRM|nr:hypothetical protein [Anaerobium acetethylicum]SCP97796.1 hypothetical protein SAMN05421730_10143 [Anaerobium acetethylicum]